MKLYKIFFTLDGLALLFVGFVIITNSIVIDPCGSLGSCPSTTTCDDDDNCQQISSDCGACIPLTAWDEILRNIFGAQ